MSLVRFGERGGGETGLFSKLANDGRSGCLTGSASLAEHGPGARPGGCGYVVARVERVLPLRVGGGHGVASLGRERPLKERSDYGQSVFLLNTSLIPIWEEKALVASVEVRAIFGTAGGTNGLRHTGT